MSDYTKQDIIDAVDRALTAGDHFVTYYLSVEAQSNLSGISISGAVGEEKYKQLMELRSSWLSPYAGQMWRGVEGID